MVFFCQLAAKHSNIQFQVNSCERKNSIAFLLKISQEFDFLFRKYYVIYPSYNWIYWDIQTIFPVRYMYDLPFLFAYKIAISIRKSPQFILNWKILLRSFHLRLSHIIKCKILNIAKNEQSIAHFFINSTNNINYMDLCRRIYIFGIFNTWMVCHKLIETFYRQKQRTSSFFFCSAIECGKRL